MVQILLVIVWEAGPLPVFVNVQGREQTASKKETKKILGL